ncbi:MULTISPECIES: hypothetical protein [Parachlamydia]|uniref:hypothetical protein n=1 Tax=Parachlamydia TaxID=83551 RepID=UPI0007519190|nr:hypothetical protein [Parachlamydia acanthamoebae]
MINQKSFVYATFLLTTLVGSFAYGATSSSAPGSSSSGSSFGNTSSFPNPPTPGGTPGKPATTPPKQTPFKRVQEKPPAKPMGTSDILYTSPGVIALKDGVWAGSDHLYNLTDKIGISIEVIKPANFTAAVSEESLKKIVAEIFEKGNLAPIMRPGETSNPLPFFHILVMLYPHEGALAVFCEGRLFENVQITRVFLDKDTQLQAITWEKQSIVIIPLFDAQAQVSKAVANIATAFVDRYKYFEHVKIQRQ